MIVPTKVGLGVLKNIIPLVIGSDVTDPKLLPLYYGL